MKNQMMTLLKEHESLKQVNLSTVSHQTAEGKQRQQLFVFSLSQTCAAYVSWCRALYIMESKPGKALLDN